MASNATIDTLIEEVGRYSPRSKASADKGRGTSQRPRFSIRAAQQRAGARIAEDLLFGRVPPDSATREHGNFAFKQLAECQLGELRADLSLSLFPRNMAIRVRFPPPQSSHRTHCSSLRCNSPPAFRQIPSRQRMHHPPARKSCPWMQRYVHRPQFGRAKFAVILMAHIDLNELCS
jgi:hypothetical protein